MYMGFETGAAPPLQIVADSRSFQLKQTNQILSFVTEVL